MPDGCNGTVVGWCDSGTEPLFATRMADATTVGFGSGLPTRPVDDTERYLGDFTNSGYFVVPPSTRAHSGAGCSGCRRRPLCDVRLG